MTTRFESLARDESTTIEARDAIWKAAESEDGHRQIYGALCRWTWRAIIEHRLDAELKGWHRLLLDAAAKIAITPKKLETPGRQKLDREQAAERIRALADLLRLSITAAEVTATTELTGRAHIKEILRFLSGDGSAFVDRESIKTELGLRDANLSRILTLLTANGLIERQPRGKNAAFRLTSAGLMLVEKRLVEQPKPPQPLVRASDAKYDLKKVFKEQIRFVDAGHPSRMTAGKKLGSANLDNELSIFVPGLRFKEIDEMMSQHSLAAKDSKRRIAA